MIIREIYAVQKEMQTHLREGELGMRKRAREREEES